MIDRNKLGPLVRETWVNWAKKQPDAKPSWLTPWEKLDDGQKEVDQLIGEAIAHYISSSEYSDPTSGWNKTKKKIATLEDRITNQATVINALNRSVAQLMNHVRRYFDASRAVIDKYEAVTYDLIHSDLYDSEDMKDLGRAITGLHQVALTKQAVDMGPYEAVGFTRLAADYITLRENARAILTAWDNVAQAAAQVDPNLTKYEKVLAQEYVRLRKLLETWPTPDCTPGPDQIAEQWRETRIPTCTYPVSNKHSHNTARKGTYRHAGTRRQGRSCTMRPG